MGREIEIDIDSYLKYFLWTVVIGQVVASDTSLYSSD